jgi:long-chain acyl-CoA synthetase
MTVRPGHLVPLRGGAPADLVRRALEVRAAGGVPLLGDDRWSESYWRAVRDRSAAAGPQPAQGWATLTSGTTGEPRIVLRTAASWADSFPAVGALLDLGPDDVLALSSPPASSLSLFSVAHAATVGCSLALPTTHALTPDDARDATRFHGAPNGLRALLDGEVPPRLRVALIGGAALDPGLRARAEGLGIRVASYYGAAELSFVAVDDGVDPRSPASSSRCGTTTSSGSDRRSSRPGTSRVTARSDVTATGPPSAIAHGSTTGS